MPKKKRSANKGQYLAIKGEQKKTRPFRQTNFAQHSKPNQTTIEAYMIY